MESFEGLYRSSRWLVPVAVARHKSVMDAMAPWQSLMTASLASSGQFLRAALAMVVDTVLPPRCAACRVVTVSDAGFCAECWAKLDFLIGPACARCDLPFEMPQGDDALCGSCMADLPPYSHVHVPLAYGDVSRSIVMRLKYGRRTGFAHLMARLMAGSLQRSMGEVAPDDAAAPLIIPVPLHRWRIWTRGFNQSAEIGRQLSRMTGWPMAVDIIERHRRTPPLRGLGRVARARTVRGAFRLTPDGRARLAGRRILLVDDVFTTGSTAAACARLLLRAGAVSVEVTAFARVVDREALLPAMGADIDSK